MKLESKYGQQSYRMIHHLLEEDGMKLQTLKLRHASQILLHFQLKVHGMLCRCAQYKQTLHSHQFLDQLQRFLVQLSPADRSSACPAEVALPELAPNFESAYASAKRRFSNVASAKAVARLTCIPCL